jgi:N-acetylglucosaminyldiphosphoundecaprenol N-acetyl-beta-D-mannosaminyltransferase
MRRTIDAGRDCGLKHYLYGADPETVERLAGTLRERYPGVEIVGVESPPFRPLSEVEEQELFERVGLAKPDIFWVGLGTPRQDTFVAKYAERLGCTLVPVGAAFDFISGSKRSAPQLAQKLGLEWAFRFASEPVRLWRRYVFGIPIFLLGVATDRWFRGRPLRTAPAPANEEEAAQAGADPLAVEKTA